MMLATITVDTEPDNVWGNFRSGGLDNIHALERFHSFMAESGVPPTYLITNSVASDPAAVSRLQRFARTGPLPLTLPATLGEVLRLGLADRCNLSGEPADRGADRRSPERRNLH